MFHFGILENYAPVISKKGEILSSIIDSHIQNYPNKPINFYDLAVKFSLDTICNTVMGICDNILLKPETEYLKALKRYKL